MKNLSLCLLLVLPASAEDLRTVEVVAGPWSKTVTLPAEALPYHRVRLGTDVTGWVGEIRADIGHRVKKGDLLAEIRAPELVAAAEARAEEARAAQQLIARAGSILKSAEADAAAETSGFERVSRLAATGSVTAKAREEAGLRSAAADAKVAEARAGVMAAEAGARAAAARAEEAAAALESTRITAPFDGVVVARHAEPGDFLGSDSVRGKLFVIEQPDPLRIRIHVPEHAAAHAGAGDAAVITMNGLRITAKLDRTSGSLDPVTKTLTAEVDVKASGILPGAMGSAALTLASIGEALMVPLTAVDTAGDGKRFVRILDGGAAREVPVTLEAVDGRNAILSSGPAKGSKVIIP